MNGNGANPILVIQQNLPGHIKELEERREKLVEELIDLNKDLAQARTLVAIVPEEVKSGVEEPGTV